MTLEEPERHLVLLRHAKSAWPHGVPDHERPLAGRGRRNAQAAGLWLATEGPPIDLALCSDAVRALHTWEIVRGCLATPPPTTVEPGLYGADSSEVIALIQTAPADVRSLVVVGHEPTMSATVLLLAGDGSDRAALGHVEAKFPTSGIAVLRFGAAWTQLRPGSAALDVFAVPRA